MITRTVLFEKAPTDDKLYVYAYPDARCKNPTLEIHRQRDAGFAMAKRYGLREIDMQECIWLVQKDTIIPRVFQSLMKLVILGKVKHIYIDQIHLLATKRKALVLLYIQIFVLFKVKLYDRNGLINLDHVNCRNMPWGDDLQYLIDMFDRGVKNPIESMEPIN
ncbi:MAG TPA: hypothetical protein VF411_11285 [Bacteroidia bacterium]